VKIKDKELPGDVLNGTEAEPERGVEWLTLRIENGALGMTNVCFHAGIIAKRRASESGPYRP